MVEPTDAKPAVRRHALRAGADGAGLRRWLAGSARVRIRLPVARLDECHRVSPERSARRTTALQGHGRSTSDRRTRTSNQRAVDDARRITAQEEAVERLEKSVQAYQAEREKLAAAFDALKRQVRLAVNASPADLAACDRIAGGVREGPSRLELRRPRRTLSCSADRLFEPGPTGSTPRRSRAEDAREAARAAVAKTSPIEVAAYSGPPSPVQKAGSAGDVPESATGNGRPTRGGKARFLAAAPAARVRDAGRRRRPGPNGVRLVPASTEPDAASATEPVSELPPPRQDPGEVPDRRIEIRLPPEFRARPSDPSRENGSNRTGAGRDAESPRSGPGGPRRP